MLVGGEDSGDRTRKIGGNRAIKQDGWNVGSDMMRGVERVEDDERGMKGKERKGFRGG